VLAFQSERGFSVIEIVHLICAVVAGGAFLPEGPQMLQRERGVASGVTVDTGGGVEREVRARVAALAVERRMVVIGNVPRQAETHDAMVKLLQRRGVWIQVRPLVIAVTSLAAGGLLRLELAVQARARRALRAHVGVAGLAAFRRDALQRRVALAAVVLKVGVRSEALQRRSLLGKGGEHARAENCASRKNDSHDDS
jgi:hypothetical protein